MAKKSLSGAEVAKKIVGLSIQDAEELAENNGFELELESSACRFKDNRVQYQMQFGIVTAAWHG